MYAMRSLYILYTVNTEDTFENLCLGPRARALPLPARVRARVRARAYVAYIRGRKQQLLLLLLQAHSLAPAQGALAQVLNMSVP
jgi:hypothetical protein